MSIDKNDVLKTSPFSYRVNKDKKLFISYEGKQVMILKEKKAGQLLSKLNKAKDEMERQLLLAKVTGNFKRGNEKSSSK